MFFFSSRRRHTRLVSDWSSDVCSSDLAATYAVPVTATAIEVPGRLPLTLSASVLVLGTDPAWYALLPGTRIVAKIGRASCRERVKNSIVARSIETQNIKETVTKRTHCT